MSPQRRCLWPALLAALLGGALVGGCSSSPGPQATADAYLAAWARQDWAAMQKLVVNAAGNGGPTCGPIVAKFLGGL